ncbi:3-oxoacyl-ACP synthase III family protein, partial [Frankia sp. CiP3]|uniref:3-oxoacyl-ACP synthase III family protein n=1 Tax=Frankia sp. CiP3 TaxID=2880971 RepID=UPI001EF44744
MAGGEEGEMGIGVLGVGYYAPETEIDNGQIAEWADTEPEWVHDRTGVRSRRYAAVGEATSDLAVNAARRALRDAGCASEKIGLLAVATSTPDQPLPGTAAHVQRELALPSGAAFDINAVCSGYVYGCIAAAGMLLAGGASGPRSSRDHALVVGADSYSRIMNRADRKTVSLFGDGAGATVLGPVPDGYGIIGYSLTCDGGLAGLVEVPAGGTRLPLSEDVYRREEHLFRMDGRAAKEYAMMAVPKMIDECVEMAGVSLDEVSRVILHR